VARTLWPDKVDDGGVTRVTAGLDHRTTACSVRLVDQVVVVAANDDGEEARLGQGQVLLEVLMGEGDDLVDLRVRGAQLLAERERGLARWDHLLGSATKGAFSVHRLELAPADAETDQRDCAGVRCAIVADQLVQMEGREPGLEVGHVRIEPDAPELLYPLQKLLLRYVALVVPEADYVHRNEIEQLHHASPGVQRAEQRGGQEVARQGRDHVIWLEADLLRVHERPEARQVLKLVDIVD